MAEEIMSGIRSLNEPQTPAFNAGVPLPEPGPLTAESLNPAEAEWGGPDVECHVTGTGFTPSVMITVDGADAATAWHSPTDVSTTMLASTMLAAATVQVTVKRGDEETATLDFNFIDPVEMADPESGHRSKHKTTTKKSRW